MRLGIRLQLLAALGALLGLAFVPLFFAVASLTSASMTQARELSARALGRAVAAHLATARATRPPAELEPLIASYLGQGGVAAIAVLDASGNRLTSLGNAAALKAIPPGIAPGAEEIRAVRTSHGAALLLIVPSAEPEPGSVAVVIRTDAEPAAPLVRLVALYTGVMALSLLVFAYFSLTRLIVRPIDELSRAAGRVAAGARSLEVPRGGARELGELGESLSRMMAKLRADEEALRTKIAEIERYAADLKSAQQRLIRSERLASVGRLSAGLAHEIGNPIAAILGFQDLLLEGGLDPREQRDFLERMKRETERIHHVLRDLLDFARPPVREAGGRPGIVEVAVRDALSLVKPQKSARGIEISAEIEPSLPEVTLPPEGLVQVLLNLLLNAIDELGLADVKPGRILVRAHQTKPEGMVRLEVLDNGRGLANEVRDTLFEPFVTTKEVGRGTGLGLAVCRGLVESAGGSIFASDRPEGGARFVVDLPVAEIP